MGISRSPRRALTALSAIALVAAAAPFGTQPAAFATPAPVSNSSPCTSLDNVIGTLAEPTSTAERQTGSWVLLQEDGWTAPAPNNDWTLTASDAGADINSPNGQSDASLLTWYSLSAWTLNTLGAKFFNDVTDVHKLCETRAVEGPGGETQGIELTADNGGEQIQVVLLLALLRRTTETYVGETRWLYTPKSQWSSANIQTLALIMRLTIQSPQSLGGNSLL